MSYRPAAAEPPPLSAAHAHVSSTGDGQASVRLRPLTVSRPAVALYATWLAGSAATADAGTIVPGLLSCAACRHNAFMHATCKKLHELCPSKTATFEPIVGTS